MTRLICLADTHGHHRKITVPSGDILIHAGDFTWAHSATELPDFKDWLISLPHPLKIFVAGNHDWCFQTKNTWARRKLKTIVYLQDSAHVAKGLKFYGSPWQPRFYDWAFNLDRGSDALKEKWAEIPIDTNVLITHGPPADTGDYTTRGDRIGCQDLKKAIERVKPQVHIFGHNHRGYGVVEKHGTIYINASICTERYAPTNEPIILDL